MSAADDRRQVENEGRPAATRDGPHRTNERIGDLVTEQSISLGPLEARFWSKVQKSEGCWLWTGYLNAGGYGVAYDQRCRKNSLAHRLSYELAIGPIPAGLTLDHLCRTRSCVRPDHLAACTIGENLRAPGSQWAKGSGGLSATHCSRGHLFDARNSEITNRGVRRCRACRSLTERSAPKPGRRRSVSGFPHSYLNTVAAQVIRFLSARGVSGARLARAYGVSQPAISQIKNGRAWQREHEASL